MSEARSTARSLRFRLIATTTGGVAAAVSNSEVIARANENVRALAGDAREEIARRIDAIGALGAQDCASMFSHAHDIRGIAGSFDLAGVGAVADALCLYLDEAPPAVNINAPLIELLTTAMRRAMAPESDVKLSELASICRLAVQAAMAREGRVASLR